MKILAALLVVAAIAVIGAWEMLWRLENFPRGGVASWPTENYIAQVRSLSEGQARPYGQGVFVRHRYNPFWATSKLVFAGYCKPDMRLAWASAKQLTASCVVTEGTVVQFQGPAGITVVHDGGA